MRTGRLRHTDALSSQSVSEENYIILYIYIISHCILHPCFRVRHLGWPDKILTFWGPEPTGLTHVNNNNSKTGLTSLINLCFAFCAKNATVIGEV